MDLADLWAGVDGAMKRAVALALFIAGGAAASGAARVVEALRPVEPARLVVEVAGLDAAARERAIDQAVLTEVGLALGWRDDPVITERIMRALEGVAPDAKTPEARFAIAEATDLLRRDPLLRARLAERARRTLPEPGTPPEAELDAFYRAHAADFAAPPMITFGQRFAAGAERLAHMIADPADRGEPEITFGPGGTRALPVLERFFGAAGAAALMTAPLGEETRLESGVGHHLVRVLARTSAIAPPLSDVRPRVLEAWRKERRPALERAALDRLRAGFAIEVRL